MILIETLYITLGFVAVIVSTIAMSGLDLKEGRTPFLVRTLWVLLTLSLMLQILRLALLC